jgi:hypothetical protein
MLQSMSGWSLFRAHMRVCYSGHCSIGTQRLCVMWVPACATFSGAAVFQRNLPAGCANPQLINRVNYQLDNSMCKRHCGRYGYGCCNAGCDSVASICRWCGSDILRIHLNPLRKNSHWEWTNTLWGIWWIRRHLFMLSLGRTVFWYFTRTSGSNLIRISQDNWNCIGASTNESP